MSRLFFPLPVSARQSLYLMIVSVPVAQKKTSSAPNDSSQHHVYLTYRSKSGITVTQGWTTAALLDTKVEFASLMSQPVKAEFQNLFNPNAPSKAAQKLNLTFKQPNLHARAFLDHSAAGNINALIDATVGHEGFVAGAEAGYDVSKAAITRYSAGLGYQAPTFTASLIAMQNLSVLAASYYQKVNSNVEAGAKATYDLQGGKSVGLEVASKYKLDPLSFAKVRFTPDSFFYQRHLLTEIHSTGQDQRPRYCCSRLQHQAQRWHHLRCWSFARHQQAQRGWPQDRHQLRLRGLNEKSLM